MRIVLLGAPGSGKGTQSQRLAQLHGAPHISTGDLLRAAKDRGTALGLAAKAAMDAGQLVADDIVLGMIRERLAESDVRHGFILDGFPRNLDQARALGELLKQLGQPLDAVLLMEVPEDELVRRIAGRRTCRQCDRVFNIYTSPPASNEPCPKTGGPHQLYQRPDDNEQTVKERLRVYDEKTKPLIEYYAARGLLHRIAGTGELGAVTERLEAVLRVVSRGARPRRATARAAARRGSTTVARAARKRSKKKVKAKGTTKARRPVRAARRPVRKTRGPVRKTRTARRTKRRRG
jgi:adenylate kinase